MKRVVAIPARYDRTMTIPEGVKRWEFAAMWADYSDKVDKLLINCPGVVIPASLTYISDDQFEMLNRLHNARADGDAPFTIEVAAKNPAFAVDENGFLCRRSIATIVSQPQDWNGRDGEYPSITVAAEGDGLTYRWYWRNAGDESWSASSDRDSCYDAYPLTAARAGREVYCVVTDKYGNSIASDTASMGYTLPAGYVAPAILSQPESWTGEWGEYPSITVAAEGTALRYRWYWRDAGAEKWTASADTDNCYDAYPLTAARNGREVFCVISNKYGGRAVTDIVTMGKSIPTYYANLAITSQPRDWSGAAGQYPQISVTARGEGLTYQWYYRNAGKTVFVKSSDTDSCYDSYPMTAARNGREVYCVVTDRYGRSVTSRVAVMRIGSRNTV